MSKLKKMIFVFFTILFMIVLIEATCRIVFYCFKTSRAAESKKFWLFSMIRKNSNKNPHYYSFPYLPYIPHQNKTPNTYTNSKSFRGYEFNEKKGKDDIRIFCLGGSTTYGYDHEIESTYPYMLEKKLNEYYKGKLKGKIEVINAGDLGWNSMELLIQMSVRCLQYDPDLFIFYEAINDCTPAFLNKDKGVTVFEGDFSHCRRKLKPQDKTCFDTLPRWLDYSALFTMVRWRVLLDTKFMGLVWATQAGCEKYYPVYNNENFVTLEVTKRNLKTMAGISKAHRIPIVYITQFYAEDHYKKGERRCFLWSYPVLTEKIKEIYQMQKQIADENPDWVYYIDIIEDMKPYSTEVTDAVHMTIKGNDILTELMKKKLIPVIDTILLRKAEEKQ
ncbi:MAG: SGNH/GDSL hydrolase family protein [Candidatus Coatesbacteria bacterium]|nr:SGNH/GDSL hydrolase family protein [Candidatus Coatesbacteria bacterium]